jgi:hypothetical protein
MRPCYVTNQRANNLLCNVCRMEGEGGGQNYQICTEFLSLTPGTIVEKITLRSKGRLRQVWHAGNYN